MVRLSDFSSKRKIFDGTKLNPYLSLIMRSLSNYYDIKRVHPGYIITTFYARATGIYHLKGLFSKFVMLETYHVISGNYYQIDIVAVERTCTSALGWSSISERI